MTGIPQLSRAELEDLARRALAEDLGDAGDITSNKILRIDQPSRAAIIAKSHGILAGVPVAEAVFKSVDKTLKVDWKISDSAVLEPGITIAELQGRARAIFAAERVALNFLQHLSGVATLTSKFVAICSKHKVRVLCTRKTIPGLRAVQRHAVAIGGGHLHRAGLYDAILVKTNHQKLSGGIVEAVRRAKANPNLEAWVEAVDLEEVEQAIGAGAERVLLDNATLTVIKKAVEIAKGKIFLEITGGVNLENVESIARLGPDAISVGAITHSATAIDLALRVSGPHGAAPRQM